MDQLTMPTEGMHADRKTPTTAAHLSAARRRTTGSGRRRPSPVRSVGRGGFEADDDGDGMTPSTLDSSGGRARSLSPPPSRRRGLGPPLREPDAHAHRQGDDQSPPRGGGHGGADLSWSTPLSRAPPGGSPGAAPGNRVAVLHKVRENKKVLVRSLDPDHLRQVVVEREAEEAQQQRDAARGYVNARKLLAVEQTFQNQQLLDVLARYKLNLDGGMQHPEAAARVADFVYARGEHRRDDDGVVKTFELKASKLVFNPALGSMTARVLDVVAKLEDLLKTHDVRGALADEVLVQYLVDAVRPERLRRTIRDLRKRNPERWDPVWEEYEKGVKMVLHKCEEWQSASRLLGQGLGTSGRVASSKRTNWSAGRRRPFPRRTRSFPVRRAAAKAAAATSRPRPRKFKGKEVKSEGCWICGKPHMMRDCKDPRATPQNKAKAAERHRKIRSTVSSAPRRQLQRSRAAKSGWALHHAPVARAGRNKARRTQTCPDVGSALDLRKLHEELQSRVRSIKHQRREAFAAQVEQGIGRLALDKQGRVVDHEAAWRLADKAAALALRGKIQLRRLEAHADKKTKYAKKLDCDDVVATGTKSQRQPKKAAADARGLAAPATNSSSVSGAATRKRAETALSTSGPPPCDPAPPQRRRTSKASGSDEPEQPIKDKMPEPMPGVLKRLAPHNADGTHAHGTATQSPRRARRARVSALKDPFVDPDTAMDEENSDCKEEEEEEENDPWDIKRYFHVRETLNGKYEVKFSWAGQRYYLGQYRLPWTAGLAAEIWIQCTGISSHIVGFTFQFLPRDRVFRNLPLKKAILVARKVREYNKRARQVLHEQGLMPNIRVPSYQYYEYMSDAGPVPYPAKIPLLPDPTPPTPVLPSPTPTTPPRAIKPVKGGEKPYKPDPNDPLFNDKPIQLDSDCGSGGSDIELPDSLAPSPVPPFAGNKRVKLSSQRGANNTGGWTLDFSLDQTPEAMELECEWKNKCPDPEAYYRTTRDEDSGVYIHNWRLKNGVNEHELDFNLQQCIANPFYKPPLKFKYFQKDEELHELWTLIMDPCAVNSSEEEGEIPIDSPCHKDNRAAQDKNKIKSETDGTDKNKNETDGADKDQNENGGGESSGSDQEQNRPFPIRYMEETEEEEWRERMTGFRWVPTMPAEPYYFSSRGMTDGKRRPKFSALGFH